jgi:hypothetical protein
MPRKWSAETRGNRPVFSNTTLYDSDEEVAPLVTQGVTDATKKAIQFQRQQQDSQRGESTRKRNHSAHASNSERPQLSRTESTSQANQRENPFKEDTEAPSIYLSKPEVAPSPSSNQCLSIGKLDAAVLRAALVVPISWRGKSRIKYVKPSRTIMRAREERKNVRPTPEPSRICSQTPFMCLHGHLNKHTLAFVKGLGERQAGHASGGRFCKFTDPTKGIGAQVQRKHHVSDTERDYFVKAATQTVGELDVDFALLGDPSADVHGDYSSAILSHKYQCELQIMISLLIDYFQGVAR